MSNGALNDALTERAVFLDHPSANSVVIPATKPLNHEADSLGLAKSLLLVFDHVTDEPGRGQERRFECFSRASGAVTGFAGEPVRLIHCGFEPFDFIIHDIILSIQEGRATHTGSSHMQVRQG